MITVHYTIKCSLKWESQSTCNQPASCQWNKVYILYVYTVYVLVLPVTWQGGFLPCDHFQFTTKLQCKQKVNILSELVFKAFRPKHPTVSSCVEFGLSKESMGEFLLRLQLDFLHSGHKQHWWDQSFCVYSYVWTQIKIVNIQRYWLMDMRHCIYRFC